MAACLELPLLVCGTADGLSTTEGANVRWPWRRRRRPFRFRCPLCGGIFFRVDVALVRRRFDRPPDITSIGGQLTCTDCRYVSNYQDYVDQHRGWL